MIVPARQFSTAVRNGFNPFYNGCIPEHMARIAGVGYPKRWTESAMYGDTSQSDWNVCSRCMIKLADYVIQGASSSESQKPATATTPYSSVDWRNPSLCDNSDRPTPPNNPDFKYSPPSGPANAMIGQNGANDRVCTEARTSSPEFTKVCLCLTGILVFMGRISSPSAASLVSPILCFLAAAKVSKGCSRVGFIALMILPILTTVINVLDRPNFLFEMYFSVSALAMLVISLVMWLSYRPVIEQSG
jgi:hypothetical protein